MPGGMYLSLMSGLVLMKIYLFFFMKIIPADHGYKRRWFVFSAASCEFRVSSFETCGGEGEREGE